MTFPKDCILPDALKESLKDCDDPCEGCTLECPCRLKIQHSTLLEISTILDSPEDVVKDITELEKNEGVEIQWKCGVCNQLFTLKKTLISGVSIPYLECDCGMTTFGDAVQLKD